MDALVPMIGAPEVNIVANEGQRRIRRLLLRFRIPAGFAENVILARDDLSAPAWSQGMDQIFERQLEEIENVMRTSFRDIREEEEKKGEWSRGSYIRFVIRINLYYHFKEPNSDGVDKEQNDYFSIKCDARRTPQGLVFMLRRQPPVVVMRPLYHIFFTEYGYAGEETSFAFSDDSKGNYKYVISDVEMICYKQRIAAAGCAKDAAHATTKIVEGRIIQSVRSPKNMCVIASIRQGLGLSNENLVAEKLQCRSDHRKIFGREFKTSQLLPLDASVLERLGDYYDTDIALVGESSHMSSKARDSVVTLHHEKHHVWLVLADDAGYCRICKKQYTSVKWLAYHRRHCHRCPLCKRAHSKEVICDWCIVCRINHPTSQACDESRSEFYRQRGNGMEEEARLVVMKFKSDLLEPKPKQELLHFDIETAQYPDMLQQVCINVEWAVLAQVDEPVGSIIFFHDSPHLYVLQEDLLCTPLYDMTVPSRPFVLGTSWRMRSSYGRDSMKEFVHFLSTSPKSYTLNAFNGSRFDHIFLLREWQNQHLVVKNVAFQGSSPIMGNLIVNSKVQHRLWDVCRHLCGSLSSNAKSAGLPVSKESFTDFHLLVSDEAVLKYRSKLQEYCRKDVQVLTLLYEITAKEVYAKFGVHIVDFITTSHMTYTLAFLGSPSSLAEQRMEKLENLKQTPRIKKKKAAYIKYIEDHKDSSGQWDPIQEIYVYRRVALENIFRSALYGGRCYPTQPKWESSQLEAVRHGALTYEEVDDYVLDLDANSLYPTAMSMPMPCGDLCRWSPPQPIPPNLGIYRIKYIPNKKLYNAPLPSREKGGGLLWSLEDGEGWYTSVDIDNATRFGYKVEYLEGYYWASSSRCFQAYIDYLYKAKDHMKQLKYIPNGGYSPALYNQLKLLLNGLWGKTSQRPVARDIQQIKSEDDLIEFFNEHTNLQFVHCGENIEDIDYWVQGDSTERSGKISKPVQIANFVLAWSRSIMLDVMNTVDPGLTDCSFLYTDTDSLFVKVNDDNKYRLESLLGSGMGQLSNDLCDPKSGGKDGKVLRMVCPSPKAYCAEYILDNGLVKSTIHAKGIHTSFFQSHGDEIAQALDEIVDDHFESHGTKRRAVFSWGSDGKVENENKDEKMYVAEAPYMKKAGALDGFRISHSHISRKMGKTIFCKREFYGSDTMSVPRGYQK